MGVRTLTPTPGVIRQSPASIFQSRSRSTTPASTKVARRRSLRAKGPGNLSSSDVTTADSPPIGMNSTASSSNCGPSST